MTTGLVVVVVGGIVVVVVGTVVAGTPGAVVGGAEVVAGAEEVGGAGVLGGTVEPGVADGAGGAGAAPPGCSDATRTPIQAVAPPAPRTTAPVRNRIRAWARSRALAVWGRRR